MNKNDLEGTLVLEKLAEIDKLEQFFEAVDSDDFAQAKRLMKRAGLDIQTITEVLRAMQESGGD